MRVTRLIPCVTTLVIAVCSSAMVGRAEGRHTAAAPVQAAEPKFDPTRDAAADVQAAIVEARRSHRHIILDVGGEWCGWCHTLDRYFVEHADLKALRDKNYVWLKVNFSPENKNEALLSRYGQIQSYPWLFVLDQVGNLLKSQQTDPLEEGPSYNFVRLKAFLTQWAPK